MSPDNFAFVEELQPNHPHKDLVPAARKQVLNERHKLHEHLSPKPLDEKEKAMVEVCKSWLTDYFKQLGITDLHWPTIILATERYADGNVAGESGIDTTIIPRFMEIQHEEFALFQSAVLTVHELYHTLAPYLLKLVKDENGGFAIDEVKSGLSYRGGNLNLLEEGMAMLIQT